MKIKNFKIGLIVMSILILLNLILFIYFFHDQKVSKNISDWADFASYIGGITSVLISVMTLLVTIFIAFEISKIDEKRNASNIEYDRKKFVRELREKEYADITENLNRFWYALTNDDREQAGRDLFVIRVKFVSFIRYKQHLFKDLDPVKFMNLDDILTDAIKLVALKDLEMNSNEINVLAKKFNVETGLFHEKIQNYIISD